MMQNPELRRNLWLEITPHRLVGAPLAIALLLALIANQAGADWRGAVSAAAVVVYVAVTILWGGRKTYESIVDEVRERTWDTQRMSALSPWEMTVGKLLGSTAFNWYVGAFCLLVLLYCHDPAQARYMELWPAPQLSILLVTTTLFLHGAGLLSGLTSVRAGRTVKPVRNLPLTVLALAILLMVGRLLFQRVESSIVWYDAAWSSWPFTLASLLTFTAWVWLGAWRLMSDLLAVRSIPWAALAFVIFLTAYLCGFVPDDSWSYASRYAAIGALVGGTAVYIEAWKERRDWIVVKRFLHAWRDESLQRALEATPDWLVVAVFTLLVSLATSLLPANHPIVPAMASNWMNVLTVSPMVMTLLMFRDIGLLYFFSLGSRPDRATTATLGYLAVLYVILPGLLNVVGLAFLALPIYAPVEHGGWPWFGIIVAAGHVAVVVALLRQRLMTV